MKTDNVKEVNGKFVKEIETDGLPKERILVLCEDNETKKTDEICHFFGAGKITIVFKPA